MHDSSRYFISQLFLTKKVLVTEVKARGKNHSLLFKQNHLYKDQRRYIKIKHWATVKDRFKNR